MGSTSHVRVKMQQRNGRRMINEDLREWWTAKGQTAPKKIKATGLYSILFLNVILFTSFYFNL